jgi:hypothetical protein
VSGSVGGDEADRWLIFRTPEGEQLARIVGETDANWTVEGRDRKRVEVRRSREERQQVLPAGSLELRHRLEPESLLQDFVLNPAEFVARLLLELPMPKSKDSLLQYLGRYGIEVDPAEWKRLQPALRKHPHIALEGDRYRWVEGSGTSSGGVDVNKLLVRALSVHATADERRLATGVLSKESASLDAARVVLARAAGCQLPQPDWKEVRLEGLEDWLVDRLLDEAATASASAFLANVALDPNGLKRAKRAAQLLAEFPERSRILTDKIDELTRNFGSAVDLHAATEYLDRRLELLLRVAGSRADQPLVTALLRLTAAIGSRAGSSETSKRLHVRMVIGAADASRSDEVLAWAVRRVEFGAAQLDMVRSALVGRAVSDPSRRRWLRALAASVNDGVLQGAGWWEGATLDDLVDLQGDNTLGPFLMRHPEIARPAIFKALGARMPSIGAVLDLPPWLRVAVDVDVLRAAVDRLDERHVLREIVRREAQQREDAARVEGELHLRALQAVNQAEVDGLRAELAHVRAELAAERGHTAELALRLRQEVSASHSHDAARRRQARLDALIALAAVASESERSLAGLMSGTLSPEEVMTSILREAQSVGVERDAEVGETVDLDRGKYRLINDFDFPAGSVIVVEPAYLTHEGGEVTVLRLGRAAVPGRPGAVKGEVTRAQSQQTFHRD